MIKISFLRRVFIITGVIDVIATGLTIGDRSISANRAD